MNLSNLKIGSKLGAAFALVIALTVLIGGFAMHQMSRIHDSTEEIAGNWMPSIKTLGDLRARSNQFRRFEMAHILAHDEQERDQIEKQLLDRRAKIEEIQKIYEPLISSPEERSTYEQYRKQAQEYFTTHAKLISLSRNGDTAAFDTKNLFRGESDAQFNALAATLGKLTEINEKGGKDEHDQAVKVYAQTQWLVLLFLAAVVVFAIALSLWITRDRKSVV